MSLARLLADIEPKYRNDILLALVCQPGTPRPELVAHTVTHCRRRFVVEEVVSEFGAVGYPDGCAALWRGTVTHFYQQHRANSLGKDTSYDLDTGHGHALLTLDGGDGIPLHRNWIGLMVKLHMENVAHGNLITGTPYFLGTCPLHVNPNAVFNLNVFDKTDLLAKMVPYTEPAWANFGFDIYHRTEMLEHASLSSVVRTDWRGGGLPASPELLLDRSRLSLWLHGYKDTNLYWIAREHLASGVAPPQIHQYNLEQLLLQEKIRRCFEETSQTVPAAKVWTPALNTSQPESSST